MMATRSCFQWPQAPRVGRVLSMLQGRQDRSQSLWQLPPEVKTVAIWSRVVVPSPGRRWELGVSSQSHSTVLGGATHFPASSSEAVGFELLTKGTGPCTVVEVSP